MSLAAQVWTPHNNVSSNIRCWVGSKSWAVSRAILQAHIFLPDDVPLYAYKLMFVHLGVPTPQPATSIHLERALLPSTEFGIALFKPLTPAAFHLYPQEPIFVLLTALSTPIARVAEECSTRSSSTYLCDPVYVHIYSTKESRSHRFLRSATISFLICATKLAREWNW